MPLYFHVWATSGWCELIWIMCTLTMFIMRSCNLLFWCNHLSSAHLLYFGHLFPSFTRIPFVLLVEFILPIWLLQYGIMASRVKPGFEGLRTAKSLHHRVVSDSPPFGHLNSDLRTLTPVLQMNKKMHTKNTKYIVFSIDFLENPGSCPMFWHRGSHKDDLWPP